MKLVNRIVTADGVVHSDTNEAVRHLDRRYGEKISKLSSKLIAETDGKYTKIQEFIDANLGAFKELMDIKHDMTTVKDERND